MIFSVEEMFSDFERVYVSPAQAKRFSNGGALDIDRIKKQPVQNAPCCVYFDNLFLGLGQNDGTQLNVLRLLTKRD